MRPLEVVHAQQRVAIGAVELPVEAHVTVEEQTVNFVALSLAEACAFFWGQRDEIDGFTSALSGGFEGVAELGDELFGDECVGHGFSVLRSK